mmetsp:Transcript_26845/g.75051  ORF Transcript_26845/g.75051 Transcript_26845/m.75051 type:complete len:212 (-) Transcript_26845:948-1583(-)
MRTHSVASMSAEVVTWRGCTTFSSSMLVSVPFLTLMPWLVAPWAWWLRSSVTICMGFRPAFSAKVNGMTSKASANALTQNASAPSRVFAHCPSWRETSTSGALPPAIMYCFCTRHRMTHIASCRLRSASSSTSLLLPRSSTLAVRPMFWMPEMRTILPLPVDTSSALAAIPSFSVFMWSTWAMGLHPRVLQMNSTSSLSMSLTTMILALAR